MTAIVSTSRRALLGPDLLLALVVSALVLIGTGVRLGDDWEITLVRSATEPWAPSPAGLLLLLAGSMSLTFRRIAPLTVLVVCAGSSLAYHALGRDPEPLPVAVLVALYAVAVVRRPLVCSMAAAVYVAVFTLGALTGWLPLTDDQYYIDLVSVVATVMIGYGVALGRARATLAEQKTAAVTRDHDTRMQAAVEAEQARIAREVHDIVAHDVSVIVAQAAAARRVFGAQPHKAVESLASIETVGRDALDGLRRLLVLLRSRPEDADFAPQPRLERLPRLLSQLERAGLDVDLTIRGTPRPLPATVELNAYRIVQEALTNSLKHAGPTRATVTLVYEPEALRVDVRDYGAPVRQASSSAGYGLISMQQRTAMLGGELVVGPEPDRGYRVSARLPVTEDVAVPGEAAPGQPETGGSETGGSETGGSETGGSETGGSAPVHGESRPVSGRHP
jgi:signal transduction histidine kinase